MCADMRSLRAGRRGRSTEVGEGDPRHYLLGDREELIELFDVCSNGYDKGAAQLK